MNGEAKSVVPSANELSDGRMVSGICCCWTLSELLASKVDGGK